MNDPDIEAMCPDGHWQPTSVADGGLAECGACYRVRGKRRPFRVRRADGPRARANVRPYAAPEGPAKPATRGRPGSPGRAPTAQLGPRVTPPREAAPESGPRAAPAAPRRPSPAPSARPPSTAPAAPEPRPGAAVALIPAAAPVRVREPRRKYRDQSGGIPARPNEEFGINRFANIRQSATNFAPNAEPLIQVPRCDVCLSMGPNGRTARDGTYPPARAQFEITGDSGTRQFNLCYGHIRDLRTRRNRGEFPGATIHQTLITRKE